MALSDCRLAVGDIGGSVMRRAFIAKDHAAGAGAFAFGLAFHQHLHAVGHFGQFQILSRNDIGKFLDLFGEVGDGFFESGESGVSHGWEIADWAALS